jgi:CRISPR-associated protein Cas2
MTVLIANDVPPAVRGHLKRWFIEPRPNVFVGTVNQRTREKVLAFVFRHAPDLGLLVVADDASAQGFTVLRYGDPHRRPVTLTGLTLIAEAWADEAPPPPTSGAGLPPC